MIRRRIYNLLIQLLLGLASGVILGSKFRRALHHILRSYLRLVSILSPLTTCWVKVEARTNRTPHGMNSWPVILSTYLHRPSENTHT
jgi:hypothetical protein